jgi:Xaa-Pro aminopeptidase
MPILSMEEKMSILSHQERDRRWKNVREAMAKQGLDCLIVYGCFGRYRHLNASLRYLCNFNTEGYIVFPLQGDPTLSTFMGGFPTPWVADNRTGQPKHSKTISDRLKELKLEKAKIGLAELSGYNGEQGFPHTTYAVLTSNFPNAKFEDATDIILDARLIKSPAEIKCLEFGCKAGEKAIQTVVDTAKPGVKDYEVRAKFMDTLFREGCDISSMILYHAGKELVHGSMSGMVWAATPKVMEKGDVIHTEFDANFMGYVAQFNQPFSVGEPSKEWMDIFKIVIESVNSGLKVLKAGITVGELSEAMSSPILKAGYRQRTPNFHGLGLSIEEPIGGFPGQPTYQAKNDRVLKPNMVLEFEPSIVSQDHKRGSTLGCPTLITDTGYRFLAKNWKPEVKIIS